VKDTVPEEDGLIRAANIKMLNGKSNHPITKLYPIKIQASDSSLTSPENDKISGDFSNVE